MHPARESTRRLFIGLFPDPAVRAAVDAHRLAWSWPPGARLTSLPRVHMTMHFLGQVDPARQSLLETLLAEVRMDSLALRLHIPQVWRNQIAVLQCDENDALRALHDDIGRQVVRADLPVEHGRWLPHLTLARKAAGAMPPAACAPIAWRVDDFVLVCSHMARPLRYEVLSRYRAHG
jgi:2'-5' RNA ligase